MRRVAIVFFLVFGLIVTTGASGVAQDDSATPETADLASPVPGVAPDPALCTLPPVNREGLNAVVGTPAAATPVPDPAATPEPVTVPAGPPADAALRQVIEESMTINVACINTGDPLLQLAVYTDAGLRIVLFGVTAIDDDVWTFLTTKTPLDPANRTRIIEVGEMVVLPDGRVAAVITGDDPIDPSPASAVLFTLLERDGHWYIDDFQPLTTAAGDEETPIEDTTVEGEASPVSEEEVPVEE